MINGFRKCGTYPFDPDAIDKSRLMPTRPLPEESTIPTATPEMETSLLDETPVMLTSLQPATNETVSTPTTSNAMETSSVTQPASSTRATPSISYNTPTTILSSVQVTNGTSTPAETQIDFAVSTPKSTRSPIEKILVDANIVPQHVADIFLIPIRAEKRRHQE